MISNLLVMQAEPATKEQLEQYQDVQGWLAHLYTFCLTERPNLNLESVTAYRLTLPVELVANDINMWHTWMIVYVLMFNDKGWKDVIYKDLPKLPDYVLCELTKSKLFEGKAIATIAKNFPLRGKEKAVLKDFALRLTP